MKNLFTVFILLSLALSINAQELATIKIYTLKSCSMVYEVNLNEEKEIELADGSYFMSRLLPSGKEVYQDINFEVRDGKLTYQTLSPRWRYIQKSDTDGMKEATFLFEPMDVKVHLLQKASDGNMVKILIKFYK